MIVETRRNPTSLRNQIEDRIRSRTSGRLRNLSVQVDSGRARVTAQVASYHVRQLAEQAALDVLSADQLDLSIQVSRTIERV